MSSNIDDAEAPPEDRAPSSVVASLESSIDSAKEAEKEVKAAASDPAPAALEPLPLVRNLPVRLNVQFQSPCRFFSQLHSWTMYLDDSNFAGVKANDYLGHMVKLGTFATIQVRLCAHSPRFALNLAPSFACCRIFGDITTMSSPR